MIITFSCEFRHQLRAPLRAGPSEEEEEEDRTRVRSGVNAEQQQQQQPERHVLQDGVKQS